MFGSVFKTMVCTTFLFPYGMLPCVEKYFLKTIFNLVSACETTVLKGMLESTGWLDQIFGNFSRPSYALSKYFKISN